MKLSVIRDRNKQMTVFSNDSQEYQKIMSARLGDMIRTYDQDGEIPDQRKARRKIDPKQVNIQKRAEEKQSGYN